MILFGHFVMVERDTKILHKVRRPLKAKLVNNIISNISVNIIREENYGFINIHFLASTGTKNV